MDWGDEKLSQLEGNDLTTHGMLAKKINSQIFLWCFGIH